MEQRDLGSTGIRVSYLGFGCGNVGGLMVRGSHADQVAAVARAVEAGITYFDTAAQYGDGESERNLGRALNELKPRVYVGTKVRVPPEAAGDPSTGSGRRIQGAVARSVEASLGRLGCDSVDLIQLHNNIARAGRPAALTPEQVLAEVRAAFDRLQEQGKVRFCGITGVGETAAILRVIASRRFNSVQAPYNLLNPSPGQAVPAGFPHQDFGRLIDVAAEHGVGTIGIRVMAGGALAGLPQRHPIASSAPSPIGTAASYDDDLHAAARFGFLVEKGYAVDLPDAALRFALSNPGLSTALVGCSDMGQLEAAIASAERGPLSAQALDELRVLHSGR